jgi:hypothetical protein
MDFAELPGLEFKFFDDYKENLVEKSSEDVTQEILSSEDEYASSFKKLNSGIVLKIIPLVGIYDAIRDLKKVKKQ